MVRVVCVGTSFLTCQKTYRLLVLEANQMSILSHTVTFRLLPRLDGFRLKVIAMITKEQVTFITVRVCKNIKSYVTCYLTYSLRSINPLPMSHLQTALPNVEICINTH